MSRRAPWLLRLVWGLVVLAAVVAVVVWVAGSVALNSYFKDEAERRLSQQAGQKVTIGHLRLGLNLVRPSIAALNVTLGNDKTPAAEAGEVDFGVDMQDLKLHEKITMGYLTVDGIKVGGKPYGSYDAEVSRPPGMSITVSNLKGDYRGAAVVGNGSEDLKNHWKADIDADDVDYSLLAEGVKGGKARVTLRLSGLDGHDPVAHVSGKATLVGGSGSLTGRALDLWAGNLLTAFLPGGDKDTHLNCAVADFDIVDGVARAKTLIIDTDKATITGTGTVDLARQSVSMRFTPRTKGLAVLSLATPVVVSGPFDHISTHPDATGVAEKVGGILLGTVAAPAALLPFLHSGGDTNPCQKFLEQKSK